TPESTATGIFDGMGVAHILGWGAGELSSVGFRRPILQEENVVLFGYQDSWLDDSERDRLSSTRMTLFPRSRLADVGEAAAKVVRGLRRKTDRFVVHLDVDVVDHSDLPVA